MNYTDLMDFQKVGVEFLSKRNAALLADEVGLGKTAQVLVAAQSPEVNAKLILVICPSSVKYNWRKEAIKWGYENHEIFIVEKETLIFVKDFKVGIIIVNYDIAHRKDYANKLAAKRYDLLVLDECHYVKNKKAKRTKAVFGKGGYCDISKRTWGLSGTPVLNRPEELFCILSKLYPKGLGRFADYIEYTKHFCNGHDGNWGWDASGATNIEELAKKLSPFMLRRERNLLPELPERTLRKIILPQTKEIEKQIFQEREGNESIRRLLGIGKVGTSVEYIKDLLEDEEKIVVFAYHREVINQLEEQLTDYKPIVIMGGDTAKSKFDKVELFRTDPRYRIFIGQIEAAGVGIDGLQDVASVCVFVEIAWTPGSITQAIGRVHRQGQKRKVVVDFIIIEGSVDEDVLDRNLFKAEIVKTLMKDEVNQFEFNEKPEEKVMAYEQHYKININIETFGTKAEIENILKNLSGTKSEQREIKVETPVVAPTVTPTVKEKKQVVEIGSFIPVQTPVVIGEEKSYKDFMMDAAKRIQTSVGAKDPSKINGVMGELLAKFKTVFPNATNFLQLVDVVEQNTARKLVDTFIVEKGL